MKVVFDKMKKEENKVLNVLEDRIALRGYDSRYKKSKRFAGPCSKISFLGREIWESDLRGHFEESAGGMISGTLSAPLPCEILDV